MTHDSHLALIRETHPDLDETTADELARLETALDAQLAVQDRVDCQQDLDAIEYGLRALHPGKYQRAARRWSAVGTATSPVDETYHHQVERAREVCGRLLDEYPAGLSPDWQFRRAKKLAVERLALAKAAQAQLGTIRQTRLALAA